MYYFIYMHPLVARKITSLPQPHQKACILFPSRILTSRVGCETKKWVKLTFPFFWPII